MAHTEIYTYFTRPPGADGKASLLYSAESWIRAELVLETAGPVAVSTRQEIFPVLSGKGILLEADGEPIEFLLPRGDRLFIAAESINRVKFVVEPLPWGDQIIHLLESGFGGLKGIMGAALRRRGQAPPASKEDEPFCPPPPSIPGAWRGK
jgi:hypothetical protein